MHLPGATLTTGFAVESLQTTPTRDEPAAFATKNDAAAATAANAIADLTRIGRGILMS